MSPSHAVQSRLATRLAPRRLLSSGGKVLSEEEKAAENVYIKKMEQEKLEKLARKGTSPGEQGSSTPGSSTSGADVKAEGGPTAGLSTDKDKKYFFIGAAVGVVGAIAWHLLSKPKKSEEVAN
ncbi:hypothetical protein E2562_007246 [Oryza meyeriana var. granulata]|uniref:Uncharacterized protein n=1 Tax=Oryza meyeriana var. granulata TaxID=110450 RepID=A0A6G1CEF1_9ORYZ|nr:hypothetical protein E2562_007246 [Oryza meyeriana var. granulata]